MDGRTEGGDCNIPLKKRGDNQLMTKHAKLQSMQIII